MKNLKIKRKELFRLVMIVCCLALPMICLAQGPVDPEDTPIDGGIWVLLAAGAAYGLKKYKDARKLRGEEERVVGSC